MQYYVDLDDDLCTQVGQFCRRATPDEIARADRINGAVDPDEDVETPPVRLRPDGCWELEEIAQPPHQTGEVHREVDATFGIEDYQVETDDRLPDGWTIAIWRDGRAMVCSPGTCPRELGGVDLAASSRDEAIEAILEHVQSL